MKPLMLEINTSTIKACLFDFDGTLIDTNEIHFNAYTSALKTIDISYISFEEHVKENVGKTTEQVLEEILRKNGHTLVGLDELSLMKRHIFTQQIMKDGVKVTKGAIELLEKLKEKNIKIALVSSGKFDVVRRMMGFAKLPNIFDTIVTRELVQKTKPDPEAYEVTLKNLGVESKSSIGFENDKLGIEALLKSGVSTVAISSNVAKDRFNRFKDQIGIIEDFSEVRVN